MLNRIITEGGKTAIESELTPDDFLEWFLGPKYALGCFVAEDDLGAVGFQVYERYHADLPAGWADIGTFIESARRGGGVGRALFAATRSDMRRTGTVALRAVIRHSNQGAIAFYRGLGFAETFLWQADPEQPNVILAFAR
ncbi:GNAT family N-acetyltransferase [Microbacterium sp. X-17]|uniref:GNAT family N-acetyltransferase n=1 Tax=Microbacterium sp. X-17 TaxID=3144404 RepID=UPI0031F56B59